MGVMGFQDGLIDQVWLAVLCADPASHQPPNVQESPQPLLKSNRDGPRPFLLRCVAGSRAGQRAGSRAPGGKANCRLVPKVGLQEKTQIRRSRLHSRLTDPL